MVVGLGGYLSRDAVCVTRWGWRMCVVVGDI